MDFNELENKGISNQPIEVDFSKIANECWVDLDLELQPPEILISIGQYEYKGKFYPTPVMTAGEFSAIVAQSKSNPCTLR